MKKKTTEKVFKTVLWLVALLGYVIFIVARFHPRKLTSDYPRIRITHGETGRVITWDHLSESPMEFQVWSTRDSTVNCDAYWELEMGLTTHGKNGSAAMGHRQGDFVICTGRPGTRGVSHPQTALPCYTWKWRDPRFTTRENCQFDDVGWVFLFMALGVFIVFLFVVLFLCATPPIEKKQVGIANT